MAKSKDEAKPAETAEIIEMTEEELRIEIRRVELETAQINLEEARARNAAFRAHEQQRSTQNKQRQSQLAADIATKKYLQRICNHKQGGSPKNHLEGDGKSCLTRSRIFFSNNYLIQCNRCDLAEQRPHPSLKKTNPKKYAEAMEYYNRLLQESKENGLEPMEGPTFEFTDHDGNIVVPEPR